MKSAVLKATPESTEYSWFVGRSEGINTKFLIWLQKKGLKLTPHINSPEDITACSVHYGLFIIS